MDPLSAVVGTLTALLGRGDATKGRQSAARLADKNNLFEPRWKVYRRARAALVRIQEVHNEAELHIFDGYGPAPDGTYWETYLDQDGIEVERRAVVNELALVGPPEALEAFERSHCLFLSAAEKLKTVAALHASMANEARERPDERGSANLAWQDMKAAQARTELRSIQLWQQGAELLEKFEAICREALGGSR